MVSVLAYLIILVLLIGFVGSWFSFFWIFAGTITALVLGVMLIVIRCKIWKLRLMYRLTNSYWIN